MSIFEDGTRKKLRFPSPLGVNAVGIEELWDLPLNSKNKGKANLNDIARSISKQMTAVNEEDFVGEDISAEDEILTLKLDIVKQIIKVKKVENAKAKLASDNKAKKEKLLEALAKKRDEAIDNKSEAELLAELAELG